MPAGERRPVLDDVAGGPKNPALVQLARHIVVGTEDVEIARIELPEHEIHRLFRRPGGGRLLGAAICRERREDEAGDQQMRCDLAAL